MGSVQEQQEVRQRQPHHRGVRTCLMAVEAAAHSVALSTCEAEYMGLGDGAKKRGCMSRALFLAVR